MIGYLRGRVVEELAGRVLLDVGGIGYDVLMPEYQFKALRSRYFDPETADLSLRGKEIELFTYYHATERQPVPVLVGFNEIKEREFFELLITVAALGPMSAARALTISVAEFARRVQTRDLKGLTALPGIGARKAEQIVATLWGKVIEYVLLPEAELVDESAVAASDIYADAEAVLLQLGHHAQEVAQMLQRARRAAPEATEVQDLLDAIYRGQEGAGA